MKNIHKATKHKSSKAMPRHPHRVRVEKAASKEEDLRPLGMPFRIGK